MIHAYTLWNDTGSEVHRRICELLEASRQTSYTRFVARQFYPILCAPGQVDMIDWLVCFTDEEVRKSRLGRHGQNLSSKRTPSSIRRLVNFPFLLRSIAAVLTFVPIQVLHPRRLRCSSHIPPQNRWRRPLTESPWQHEKSRLTAKPSC